MKVLLWIVLAVLVAAAVTAAIILLKKKNNVPAEAPVIAKELPAEEVPAEEVPLRDIPAPEEASLTFDVTEEIPANPDQSRMTEEYVAWLAEQQAQLNRAASAEEAVPEAAEEEETPAAEEAPAEEAAPEQPEE